MRGALLGLLAAIGLPLVFFQLDLYLGGTGALFMVGLLVALGVAVGLTASARTRLLGAGMFIGIGTALVVGAGVCVVLFVSLSGASA